MVKTTLKQLGKQFNSFYIIGFVSEHLEPLEHRSTTSAGKPVSVLRGTAEKKMSPFLRSW